MASVVIPVMNERIEELYKEYPKVMEALNTEKPSDLSEQECKALIEVLELRNRLRDTPRCHSTL